MNSQNKSPTTYFTVAFLKICLNSWSFTEAAVTSLPCQCFGGTLLLKKELNSFSLTWLVLSLDIFTGFCVTMEMGSGFVTEDSVTVVFQPQDWPPITITKSLKTLKRFKIGFFTFSKPLHFLTHPFCVYLQLPAAWGASLSHEDLWALCRVRQALWKAEKALCCGCCTSLLFPLGNPASDPRDSQNILSEKQWLPWNKPGHQKDVALFFNYKGFFSC